jgi:hypothetical protein
MIIAIHQPQFLPYMGFFDKMKNADIFVLLDTVQFTKNEWQNRNRIKTSQGWQWLTVPVVHQFGQTIREVKICDHTNWRKKHIHTLTTNYSKAQYFDKYKSIIEKCYQTEWKNLVYLNIHLINEIKKILNIDTTLHLASNIGELTETPDERLISIIKYFNGNIYLSGIGGKNYLNLSKFQAEKIEVIFQEFKHPKYDQQFSDFEPNLSIIDFLLNCGANGNYEYFSNRGTSG